MAITKQTEDMLTSKDEIMQAFNLTEKMFETYIEDGMPALYRRSRWSASVTAIKNWWFTSRNVSMKDLMHQIRADESLNKNRQERET